MKPTGPLAKAANSNSSPKKDEAQLSQDDLIKLARKDLYVFLQVMFPVLHPGTPLIDAPYIELILCYLRSVHAMDPRRLICNLPPGYMKSTIISIMYVAWRLGVDPTRRFICISYGDDLAHELSERTRKIMNSPLYKKIFPATILEKKAQDHLKTTKGGARYATAVGSDITGFRADEIIIDDPLQPMHAASEKEKSFLQVWFHNSVITRFVDPTKGVFILVMHRLAPNDLSGVLEQLGWTTLKLPLVAEQAEEYEYAGEIIFRRAPGELLNPKRMTTKELTELRKELVSAVFESQYQQRPSSTGSGLFSIDKVQRYHLPPKFELTIHSWDIGATLNGNYSVCTKFGLHVDQIVGDTLYVLDVIRMKMILPDVEATIEMMMRQDKPSLVVIDANGVGLGVTQAMRRKFGIYIAWSTHSNQASKIERFGVAMSNTYGGKILLPVKAPFMEAWIYEMIGFPDGDYDDQVDSYTQVAAYMSTVVSYARQNVGRKFTALVYS